MVYRMRIFFHQFVKFQKLVLFVRKFASSIVYAGMIVETFSLISPSFNSVTIVVKNKSS